MKKKKLTNEEPKDMSEFDKANTYLLSLIPEEQWMNVLSENEYASAEICGEFSCFAEQYYALSKLIPKDWTIIDIGCAYNPQCYLFKDHKKIISITPGDETLQTIFKSDNCDVYFKTASEFIDGVLPSLGLDLNKTFAICNYVPDWYNECPRELAGKTFKNCFNFYPA